ncbi:MAG: hypothetical protein OEZ01_09770, partial [Candidatus Heimdallarchaeota archaeon]|nr:hypothetical protein [Candidatus Heimdallarchaeota archaeon]
MKLISIYSFIILLQITILMGHSSFITVENEIRIYEIDWEYDEIMYDNTGNDTIFEINAILEIFVSGPDEYEITYPDTCKIKLRVSFNSD